MNKVVEHITLDASKQGCQVTLTAKKGDTQTREIRANIISRGKAFYAAGSCVINAKKPDGTVVYADCTVENGTIKCVIPSSMFAAAGRVECELMVYDESSNQLTSPRFEYVVEDVLYDEDAVISTDDYTALVSALAQANALIESAELVQQYGAVPATRKVNNKPLTSDITLTATDVGAAASDHTHTAAQVGARPSDWMPTAAQVGAAASDHTHTAADVGAVNSSLQTGTLTAGVFTWTGSNTRVAKQGKVVCLYIYGTLTANINNSTPQTILTLPTGFRPVSALSRPGQTTGTAFRNYRLTVSTSGAVQLLDQSGSTLGSGVTIADYVVFITE